jgi:hypothetical protein
MDAQTDKHSLPIARSLHDVCATDTKKPTISDIFQKVNLFRCLTKHHAMKTYEEVDV